MRGRGGGAALAASPVLVGAVTVLVTIVAVFLSYNANSGLPFVPTYDLKANLPNAAQLVDGFEVRIGGARVGVISDIAAKRRDDGTSYAQVTMKLDKQIEPLPEGSTLLVRPRSAVGLKYIELTPGGRGGPDLEPGSTIPVRQVRTPVELDEFFGMFDDKARVGSRNSLDGYGGGLAGRGQDLNTAIAAFVPLVEDAEPVLRNLSNPADEARPLLPLAGRHGHRGGPRGGAAGVAVREPRHRRSPRWRRSRARSSRRRSARARPRRSSPSATSRCSARSCATTRRSSRSSVPAWRRSRTRLPSWPTPS